MNLREGIRLAVVQLAQEKLNATLTVLGVAVGAMFLVVVVSVVQGLDQYVREDLLTALRGTNTFHIRPSPPMQVHASATARWDRPGNPSPTTTEASGLRSRVSVPSRIGVETNTFGSIRAEHGRWTDEVTIQAVSNEILDIRSLNVVEGRPFTEHEETWGLKVAILGTSVREALFAEENPIGRRIWIGGTPYRTVGVFEEPGIRLGRAHDHRVVIPATGGHPRSQAEVDGIVVQTPDPTMLHAALLEAEAALRIMRRLQPGAENDFHLDTMDAALTFWDRISRILVLSLSGLIATSFVVTGVVILNLGLVSVAERTREVGIRMALGARRRDIAIQLLAEAAVLATAGGLTGIVAGVTLVSVLHLATGVPVLLMAPLLGLGIMVAVGVAISAAAFPAVRASRLDPVEALRHE